jgi:hypothetical protein
MKTVNAAGCCMCEKQTPCVHPSLHLPKCLGKATELSAHRGHCKEKTEIQVGARAFKKNYLQSY